MFQPKRLRLYGVRNAVFNRIIPVGASLLVGLVTLSAPQTARASSPSFDINTASSVQVVVNKIRPLNPLRYAPALDKQFPLTPQVADAFRTMKADLQSAGGGTLCLNSGYRSFDIQQATYTKQVNRWGLAAAENLAAHPGYSEHQTGLALDVSTTRLKCVINNFGQSSAYAWLRANAYKYGFIIRYPSGESSYTGYQFEPWHLRFVGVDLATQMHVKKVTVLEKFFKLPPAAKYLN